MTYPEESFLQLSGLQHFAFCRRQWALIHVEDQWAENFRTMDGQLFHQKAHDTGFAETRGDRVVKRGMRVYSATLGVSGACDVVEFSRQENGIPLAGHPGLWQPYPVEYKRGKPGVTHGDAWRRCSAVPSPPERSITESLAAESRWCLRKNCEQRCVRR